MFAETLQADHDLWSRGDIIAFWSLVFGVLAIVVAVIAIVVAILTLRRGNKNSSVATMIPLNAEIRSAWDEFIGSFATMNFASLSDLAEFELHVKDKLERLMNVLEIAAAISVEGTLSGVSQALMDDYLRRILEDVVSDDYTKAKVSELLQDDTTYLFIRLFLKKNALLTAALAPQWYAEP